MASYPPGKFVQEFAKRTHENLLDLRKNRPFSHKDTALIGSLLAVFVLPHERADDARDGPVWADQFERCAERHVIAAAARVHHVACRRSVNGTTGRSEKCRKSRLPTRYRKFGAGALPSAA